MNSSRLRVRRLEWRPSLETTDLVSDGLTLSWPSDFAFDDFDFEAPFGFDDRFDLDWEDFDFEAGEQLNEEDKAILMDTKRPIVTLNRVGTTVDAVAGQKAGNQQEVQP